MKNLRALEIVDFLKDRKVCSMAELMEHFQVSQATIHRDVADLARQKLINKVHGGVAINSVMPKPEESLNSHFSARIDKNINKKLIIADKAVKYIQDSDIIFLDSSTTVYQLAQKIQLLKFSNLTIISNSVLIIQEFYKFPPHFFLISLGGNFNCQLNSFLGRTAIENLKKLKINKAFFSAAGCAEDKVSTFHEAHAEFLQEVLALAEKNYLLIDSTKIGKSGIFKICNIDKFDAVISDK
ncbi:MAG: DeoR/GlpR family DNA-binding transcription regulator [Victivallaceae bacterium]|nr:DeoR/GlpR family DNA-binding transcription regulator [Victivallaceae bacterium]